MGFSREDIPGYILEGELTKEDGSWMIKSERGGFLLEDILDEYAGEKVKLTIASFDDLSSLARQLSDS
jgi:hypothetical protein